MAILKFVEGVTSLDPDLVKVLTLLRPPLAGYVLSQSHLLELHQLYGFVLLEALFLNTCVLRLIVCFIFEHYLVPLIVIRDQFGLRVFIFDNSSSDTRQGTLGLGSDTFCLTSYRDSIIWLLTGSSSFKLRLSLFPFYRDFGVK